MFRSRVAIAAIAVCSGLACRSHELVSGVTDSAFVGVMADLRKIAYTPSLDSARRTALRDSVLRRYGVSKSQLEAAAHRLAAAPDRAHDLWEAIDKRASPDTAKPAPDTTKPAK